MYAPFTMIFPEETSERLTFRVARRNPYNLKAGTYELFDIYPALQERPIYDIFLNVVDSESEIFATLFCQLNASEHEISLSLSELHLQRPEAPGLMEAVEAQFQNPRGQAWAEILLERAERMQSAFLANKSEAKPASDRTQLLRDEALELVLSHSDDPEQQEALIENLILEMRQLMLDELEGHRAQRRRSHDDKIIQFPGRRRPGWDEVHWLELQISLKELPEIWRRLRVPDSLTLTQLHRVIQTTMGWQDRHSWRFLHPRGDYASHALISEADQSAHDEHNADTVVLAELLQRKGARLEYEYGTDWLHQIKVVQRHKPATVPAQLLCIEGSMACPPEACGSADGYRQLLHILIKKRRSRADKLLLAELADYTPERFEAAAINRMLEPLGQELQNASVARRR